MAKHSQHPRICGLVKIHKENNPLRPVVSTINSPVFNISEQLNKILLNIKNKDYNVKNSFLIKDDI